MFALDVAVIIGLLVSFTKGADLLLRPHQQKTVQNFFETLTLKLSDAKAIEPALMRIKSASRLRLILWMSTIMGLIGFLSTLEFLNKYLYDFVLSYGIITILIWAIICFIAGWISACISLDISEYWIRWYLSAKTWKQLLWKTLFAFQHLVFFSLLSVLPGFERIISYGIIIQLSGFLTIAYCVTIFFTVVTDLELMIRFGRSITWRIVEYNKGAYAALTLILTIILGIVDLYFKTTK